MTAFEWDPRKAASNVRKHGVQFADAVMVLEDEQALTLRDDSIDEERWVTIGTDGLGRVLTVVYSWRGDSVRIIPARPATPRERQQYLENT
ncbi:MAG: BrnT family toxin [Bryobacteraceae bacterium]